VRFSPHNPTYSKDELKKKHKWKKNQIYVEITYLYKRRERKKGRERKKERERAKIM
jgi:hypothetical protein